MATALGHQPVAKALQFSDNGSEFSNLSFRFGIQGPRHDANDEKPLADVNTCAPLDDSVNHFFSPRGREANERNQVVPRA